MKPNKWILILGLAASIAAVVIHKGRRNAGKREKALYQQKRQAQLDEWKASLDRLKASASGADAEARIELNEHIKTLENKIEEGKEKLAELAAAGEDTWEAVKTDLESAWGALSAAAYDAAEKLKKDPS